MQVTNWTAIERRAVHQQGGLMKTIMTLIVAAAITVPCLAAAQAEDKTCIEPEVVLPIYDLNHLYVYVEVQLPDSCYEVEQGWLESWPPQLLFFACKEVEPGTQCAQTVRSLKLIYLTEWSDSFTSLKVRFGTGVTREYPIVQHGQPAVDAQIPAPILDFLRSIDSLLGGDIGMNKDRAQELLQTKLDAMPESASSMNLVASDGELIEAVVVYSQNGEIQCQDFPPPRPLQHDIDAITRLGATKICGSAVTSGPGVVIAQCGMPANRVNAIAIPRSDWEMIKTSFVGPLGFKEWTSAPYPAMDLDPSCTLRPIGGQNVPSQLNQPIHTLKGRIIRVYTTGDPLTDDFRPDRVNVELNDDGIIVDIWFG